MLIIVLKNYSVLLLIGYCTVYEDNLVNSQNLRIKKTMTWNNDPENIFTVNCKTSSLTFLAWLHKEYTDEWLKITGARVTLSASFWVCSDVWERSTIIPRRFISSTTFWSEKREEKKIKIVWHCIGTFRITTWDTERI